jgi:uncharacterized membrane protein
MKVSGGGTRMEIGRKWLWMVGVAALALGAACGDDDDGDDDGAGNVPADGNPPAAQVSFEQQIHPVLVAKCGACHGTAWGSSNVSTSYQAALLEVETSTPANSDLYERGNGESGHAKVFSDAEAALVLQWIEQGAKGPAPTTPQPTVSFSAQVHPILTASCTPCHSGTFASSTAATSFAEAKTRVNTAAPAQSVLLTKGTAQVAHGGGDRLSDADAQTILTWIQEGATNN